MTKINLARFRGLFLWLFVLSLFSGSALLADGFHNIRGLFGQRASGMGGAFGALADDPSGAFYNPAGLSLAADNYLSLSASNYQEITLSFKDVFGPGQDYDRISRTYIPNFVGASKRFSKDLTIAFTILTPETTAFDQTNYIFSPLISNGTDSTRIDYTQDSLLVLAGPSAAYMLSPKLSLGGSLYYFYDSYRLISTVTTETTAGLTLGLTDQQRRRSMGLMPILGLQYIPADQFSFGFTLKKPFTTSRHARSDQIFLADAIGQTFFSSATDHQTGVVTDNGTRAGAGVSGNQATPLEMRLSVAYIPNQNFLATFDLIRTEKYSEKRDNTDYDLTNGRVILGSQDNLDLARISTTNFAVGMEYVLSDKLTVRAGAYTNYASTPDVHWTEALIQRSLIGAVSSGLSQISNNVVLNVGSISNSESTEHIDTRGLTLGMTWGSSKSSITLTLAHEYGSGGARVVNELLTQKAIYKSNTIYIVTSTSQ